MSWNASLLSRDEDTICALTSAQGRAGISVLRVCGPRAARIAKELAPQFPDQPEDHRAYYLDLFSSENEKLDDVVMTYFAEGHSYTGDETVEISCHGNPHIVSAILSGLAEKGARAAERGEFTYRAFLNGRLDLVQAEGVMSLIQSQTLEAAKLAQRQLEGRLSQKFIDIEKDIIWTLSRLEANIDFATEGLEEISTEDLQFRLEEALDSCEDLIRAYKSGHMIREGVNIAIAGLPNAGKSSLLNALLREDRAIVSPVAGTTRDTIHAEMFVGPIKANFVDTAGLRLTSDEIEREGVERSHRAISQSELTLYIYDLNKGWQVEDEENWNKISGKKMKIGNKSDLVVTESQEELTLSTKTKKGLEELEKRLKAELLDVHSNTSAEVMQARHYECISQIKVSLEGARRALTQGAGEEIVALELREALGKFSELLGRDISEKVVDRIFKDFCIGK
ncbi:MAG: tRNA uridine-5-carboxymethylaminomethyl(34) synthesis GTPase MnmE [Bdellovibrionales bacterium]